MKIRKVVPMMLIALPLVACLIAVCLHVSTAQPPQTQQPQQVQLPQQPQPQQPPRQPQFQPGQPPAFPGQPPGFGFPPMFRMPLPVAIYANEKYVYVVRGNVLYQFDAETLQLKNRVILEDIVPPGQPRPPAPGTVAPQPLPQPGAQPRQ
ncbi:MAG: hypothetical protein RMK18_04860 [Armatimonadota bacterium]|nr:hypothetical protein [Armatimonadota bacterium]